MFGNAPSYLADDCQVVGDAGVRQPSSADTRHWTLEHSLSVGRAAVLETGPLLPQNHKSETVCRLISDYRMRIVGCHTASSGGYLKHFYSDSEATAQCELFLTAPNTNILTYLLTYLMAHWGQVILLEFWQAKFWYPQKLEGCANNAAFSSIRHPTAPGRTASPAQLLWLTGFLCAWSSVWNSPRDSLLNRLLAKTVSDNL